MDERDYRLPRTILPSRYDLTLETDLEAGTFWGAEDVTVRATERTSEVVLNAVDLELGPGWLTDGAGRRVEVERVRLQAETERAHLTLAAPIDPGEWVLHLEFRGTLSDQLRGLYRSSYEDGGRTHVIATTHFEATDARRAFPCWDEPDLKAVFGITVVADDGLAILSNGPEVAREPAGEGRVRVRFADTMPMSTYLVCVVVGRLELTEPVDVDGVPLRIAHVPGKGHLTDFALEIGAFSLRFFADYYGIPYPDRKVDFVALPDFAQGAMENLGCITYREALLLIDPEHATQQELLSVADVVAHELAHMWFGDLVTMRWWNGLWLNEAFATFMALLVVDAFRPDWDRWASFRRACTGAFEIDALDSTRSIEYPVVSPDDANGMFDTLTYTKGAAILRMLERYLGAERFRDGIRRYLSKHAHGNTETGDLWDAIEAETGAPVRRIMDSWIFQGGFPLVSAEADGGGRVRLTQRPFRYVERPDDRRWEVPLLLRGSGDDGGETRVLVGPDGSSVPGPGPGRSLVVNAESSSFVRVRYGSGLEEALWDRALEQLSPLERYQLVDDVWASVVAGTAPAGSFLELADRLRAETDLHVWQGIVGGLSWFDRFVQGETRQALRRAVRDLVATAVARLGWEPRAGEGDLVRALRGTLLSASALLGDDPDALQRARTLESAARTGGEVEPSLAAAAVVVAAARGDADLFETYLERRRSAPTPQEQLRYLYALADFPEAELVERTLELALSEEVRPQNGPFLLARAMANRDHGARAWRFVRERWEEANRRFAPSTIVYLADGVRFLTEPGQEEEAAAFFAEHPIPQAGKMLAQTLERQRIGVAFRRRATADLESLLRR
ncbi:MAG TPA: M1 family metallopeptidase [Actinomycetota bacterium]|nr:M1 family metallopeptidase [Actinomycetota bacterium]